MDMPNTVGSSGVSLDLKKRARDRAFREMKGVLPFILPALIIYVALILYPIGNAFVMSFFRWDGSAPTKEWVGIQNYVDIFTNDPIFMRALKNSALWVVLSLFIPTTWGLLLALALNRKLFGRAIFRTIFYLPAIITTIAVANIWSWMYNPFMGFLNAALTRMGLESWIRPWLGSDEYAIYAVFAAYVWMATGPSMLLFLAGLQNVPQDLIDAARVDGANFAQVFRHVTLPSLRPAFTIVIALTIINSLKVFDLVYQMTFGGPAQSTQVLASWTYFQAFSLHNYGLGMATAMVLLFFTLIIVVPYVRWATREDKE
jgi:raffinose/stachyose/melibiose transport system permease protein